MGRERVREAPRGRRGPGTRASWESRALTLRPVPLAFKTWAQLEAPHIKFPSKREKVYPEAMTGPEEVGPAPWSRGDGAHTLLGFWASGQGGRASACVTCAPRFPVCSDGARPPLSRA